MTVFAVVFDLVVTALIAALLLAMPAIVRPTLPLGVSVPQNRTSEPVVRSAIHRYRWGIAAAWVISSIASLALTQASPSSVVGVMPLVFVALSAVVYVGARRAIVVAKHGGRWYEGVPTRLVADTAQRKPAHPPFGWTLAAVLVLTATIGVGVAIYPTLPSVVATHWDAAGNADATAEKSIWSVFGAPLMILAVVLGLYGLSWLTMSAPPRTVVSDTAEQARLRAEAQHDLTATGLGILALAMSFGVGATTIVGWLAPGSAALMAAALVTTGVLVLGAVAVMLVRYSRLMRRASAPVPVPAVSGSTSGSAVEPTRADAPDDDRFWKLGAVYINRDDPAMFVPKRFGVGWTINLGRPGGIVFAVVALLLVLAALVTAIVVPVSR